MILTSDGSFPSSLIKRHSVSGGDIAASIEALRRKSSLEEVAAVAQQQQQSVVVGIHQPLPSTAVSVSAAAVGHPLQPPVGPLQQHGASSPIAKAPPTIPATTPRPADGLVDVSSSNVFFLHIFIYILIIFVMFSSHHNFKA